LDWKKTEELSQRDFDNTLEGVKSKINEFSKYKTEEKPEKTAEKIEIERLYTNIALKLSANNRPAFQPKEGCSTAQINALWNKLEQAEKDRNSALEEELARQERLEALVNRFKVKAKVLTDFANGKQNLLQSQEGEQFNSVAQVQVRLQMLDAFDQDLENSKTRLNIAIDLGNEIIAADYKDKDEIQNKINELNGLWETLGNLSTQRRETLNTELARQEQMEDLRKQFAAAAKSLDRYVKDACENARDHTSFGLTLADVENYRADLENNEKEVLGEVDSKKATLDELDSKLKELGVVNNRYTHLTVESVATRIDTLKTLLQERVTAYEAELQRQQAMEEKRKEFAAAAEEFVNYLVAKRSEISEVDGEPEEQQQKVNELYNEQDGDDKLAAIGKLDQEMREMKIVTNSHTNLSYAILEARWNAFKAFVKHTLEDIDSALLLKQNQEAALKEIEEQQKLEDMRIEFAKKVQVLNEFLQNCDEVLNEPVQTNSVEGLEPYQKAFDELNAQFPGKTEDKEALVQFNEQLVAAGINENPLAELTAAELTDQWNSVTELFNTRKQTLAAELERQNANESLRVSFAEKATALHESVAALLEKVNNVEGDTQAQIDSLNELNTQEPNALLSEVSTLNDQLKEAGVRDNKHTNHTFAELETQVKSLQDTINDKRTNLESLIMSEQHSKVPPEALQEIKECFAQFDKEGNGYLVSHELKACLSALDENVSDEQLNDILGTYGDENANVTLNKFVDFMVSRLEDTHSQDQILDSFRTLCNNRESITEAELQPAFGHDPDTLNFLLANMSKNDDGSYDYVSYVNDMFSR